MSLFTGQKTWTPTIEEVTGNGDTLNNLQKFTMGAGASRWEANISDGMWLGADTFATAPFSVDFLGNLLASSVTIKNSSGSVLIDSDSSTSDFVQVLNSKLNTETKKILSDFDFGTTDYAGAVKSGDITWNSTTGAITGGSGVVVYRGGILGAKAGVAQFTINASTGDATFAGTVAGASGTFGEVTAGTFTGCVFQSAKTLYRVKMSSAGLQFLYNDTVKGSIGADTGDTIVLSTVAGGNFQFFVGTSSLGVWNTDGLTMPLNDKLSWSGAGDIQGLSDRIRLNSKVEIDGDCFPDNDKTYDLGASDKLWDVVWAEEMRVEDNIEPIADSAANLGTTDRYWEDCYCDDYHGDGLDYAEMFESFDGKAIDNGTSVVFVKGTNKVREAEEGEKPFGVISARPSFVGNSSLRDNWERDDFGAIKKCSKGNKIRKKDKPKNTISKRDLPEWNIVGLVGVLRIKKEQQVADNWILMRKISNKVNEYLIK